MARLFVRWTNGDGEWFALCTDCRDARRSATGMPGYSELWPSDETAVCNDCGARYYPPVMIAHELERITTELASAAVVLATAIRGQFPEQVRTDAIAHVEKLLLELHALEVLV